MLMQGRCRQSFITIPLMVAEKETWWPRFKPDEDCFSNFGRGHQNNHLCDVEGYQRSIKLMSNFKISVLRIWDLILEITKKQT